MPLPSFHSISKRLSLLHRVLWLSDARVDQIDSLLSSESMSEETTVAPAVCDLDSTKVELLEPVIENNESEFPVEEFDTDEVSELGRKIAERINRNLHDAREKTEDAVLAVCKQVARLVEIAQTGNAEAQGTLCAVIGGPACIQQVVHEASITDVIQSQSECVNAFITENRAFFQQQLDAVNDATGACREMQLCVAQVVKLVFSSEILAYNIQIESARLGDQGRAFSVLGDEMVRFSCKVRDANIAIQKSLNQVTESMQRFHEESKDMETRLDAFTTLLHNRMADIEARTSVLSASFQQMLDRITDRNQQVIDCSNNALSELQFQDPLAQSLLRTVDDVTNLQRLVETGEVSGIDSFEAETEAKEFASREREPGVVDLF